MPPEKITFGATTGFDYSAEVQAQLPEIAKQLEGLGFDSISLGEHVMMGRPPEPSGLAVPMLAAPQASGRRARRRGRCGQS